MRAPDWPERLEAFLRARVDQPFAWGRQDCVTFAADAVMAMGCPDPIADLRGWSNPRAAWRALDREHGLPWALARRYREQPIGLAGRGDVGLIQSGRRLACVVILAGDCVGPGRDGLMLIPRADLISAYRVD
jgi:hypothetical protein